MTTTEELSPTVLAQLSAALSVGNVPDIHWLHGDDLCDCTFQRIGDWTNSYLGKTLRVRLCCIWAEIYKMFPQFVQDIDASYDYNYHQWVTEPQPWDSPDADMPPYLWYRQLAQQQGRSVADIRDEYSSRLDERPRKVENWKSRPTPRPADVERARNERLRLQGWF